MGRPKVHGYGVNQTPTRQRLISNDASSKGLLALVFPTLTCPGSCPELFTRRSLPRLFTAAARAGLRPAPESRSRGACPHLLRSFTTRISFRLLLLPCFCSTHHVPLSPNTILSRFFSATGVNIQRSIKCWRDHDTTTARASSIIETLFHVHLESSDDREIS
jgi:hypothetical protein